MKQALKYTFMAVGLNLFIAFVLLLAFLSAHRLIGFLIEFLPNLILGITGLVTGTYIVTPKLERLICFKKWNAILVGIVGMYAILICGVAFGASIGFLMDVLQYNSNVLDAFYSYFLMPLVAILVVGSLSTIIIGVVLGKKLKKLC